MPLFSWFSKKSSEQDYEQILASLALSIQKRQTRLSELRLRERRATLMVTTWTFAAWLGYVALWWAGIIGVRGRTMRGAGWGVPVVVGPIIILFTRRIVQLWYTRKGNTEEKTLKDLLVKQRNTIEEIKKKTNYYTTKSLLDRYDSGSAAKSRQAGSQASTPLRRGAPEAINTQHRPPATPSAVQAHPQTPVRGHQPQQPPTADANMPFSAALPPLPPPQKQWYDKLADALLGDDTASTGASPSTRYALICERCFSHNGLVKEEHWEDAQYLCPKCGHFNQSARARKALTSAGTSPTTPQSSAPASTAAGVPLPQSAGPSSLSGSAVFSSAASTSASTATSSAVANPSSSQTLVNRHLGAAALPSSPNRPSPLSESTVMVEMEDADEGRHDEPGVRSAGAAVGYDVERMEVDS